MGNLNKLGAKLAFALENAGLQQLIQKTGTPAVVTKPGIEQRALLQNVSGALGRNQRFQHLQHLHSFQLAEIALLEKIRKKRLQYLLRASGRKRLQADFAFARAL